MITSWPTRGMFMPPKPVPAHGWLTGTQHELSSFMWLCRSQWKCTRTRPNSSVWISSPAAPTTVAVSTPDTFGFGVDRAGR